MPRAIAKPNDRKSRPARRAARFLPAAHLYGLWAFAVAQPILDLIGREPDFIAAHRLFGLQLPVLALGLALFVPTALAAPLLFAAFRESRLGRVWAGCFSALFAAAFLLQLVDSLPGAAAVLAACAGGIGFAVCPEPLSPGLQPDRTDRGGRVDRADHLPGAARRSRHAPDLFGRRLRTRPFDCRSARAADRSANRLRRLRRTADEFTPTTRRFNQRTPIPGLRRARRRS